MFKKGDKLRCVNASDSQDRLVLNKTYEAVADSYLFNKTNFVAVVDEKCEAGWLTERFEKVSSSPPAPRFLKGDKLQVKSGFGIYGELIDGKVYEAVADSHVNGSEYVRVVDEKGQSELGFFTFRFRKLN